MKRKYRKYIFAVVFLRRKNPQFLILHRTKNWIGWELVKGGLKEGENVLIKSGVSSEWATLLAKIAKNNIRPPQVKIGGILDLTTNKPNGVSVLKKAFSKAKNLKKPNNTEINIYVTGAPKYRIEVYAENYKIAESLLAKAVKRAIKIVEDDGGVGEFIRKS